MKLKSKLTKDEFDKLPEAQKEFYKESAGSYVLDTDDAEELRTAAARAREDRDNEKRAREELQNQLNELKNQLETINAEKREAEAERLRKEKDIPALENSWKEKLDAANAAAEQKINGLKEQLRKILVDNKAHEIANKISTSPSLILPHIRARLNAEINEGTDAITRVLDADGKPSAMSLKELEEEFVANQDFAAIIKGTSATGGGAANNGGAGGGGGHGKKFSEMSETERVALARTNPAKFREMAQAEGITLPN